MNIGNRFASIQPIAEGLHAEFGATSANAGKGLKLRMDHGDLYTDDEILKQIAFWGINTTFAFVAVPQPNGAVEGLAGHGRCRRSAVASCATARQCTPPSPSSRIVTIGIAKNWPSRHLNFASHMLPARTH